MLKHSFHSISPQNLAILPTGIRYSDKQPSVQCSPIYPYSDLMHFKSFFIPLLKNFLYSVFNTRPQMINRWINPASVSEPLCTHWCFCVCELEIIVTLLISVRTKCYKIQKIEEGHVLKRSKIGKLFRFFFFFLKVLKSFPPLAAAL